MTVTAHLPFSWITHHMRLVARATVTGVVLDLFLGYPSANVKCHGIFKRATVPFCSFKTELCPKPECSEPFKLTPIICPSVKLWAAFWKPYAM